jgi:hypothetical protein
MVSRIAPHRRQEAPNDLDHSENHRLCTADHRGVSAVRTANSCASGDEQAPACLLGSQLRRSGIPRNRRKI